MQMTKEQARKLRRGDFIPRGPVVDPKTLDWKETREGEIQQCCCPTGNDIQSGPIYCGRIADFIAFKPNDPGTHVALCRSHFRDFRLKESHG